MGSHDGIRHPTSGRGAAVRASRPDHKLATKSAPGSSGAIHLVISCVWSFDKELAADGNARAAYVANRGGLAEASGAAVALDALGGSSSATAPIRVGIDF